MTTCRDCPAPAARRSKKGPAPIYCKACRAKRNRLSKLLSRTGQSGPDRRVGLAPDPPPAAFHPREPFMLLLRSGWADTPGTRIPPDVRADAEAGRMPRARVQGEESQRSA